MIFPNLKCYNFVSQNVSSLPNQSLTFCSTNSQFINVRKDEKSKKIYVEISDLNNVELIQNKFQVPFRSVDKIIFCEEGNYLALIGLDSNQFAKICIYFNWWLEQKAQCKSKFILNEYDSAIKDKKFIDKDQGKRSSILLKPNLEFVEIKTDYFKDEEAKRVKVSCCKQSGNFLIGYGDKIQIYKYVKKYSINDRSLANNFVHILDVKIKFNAEHFKLTEQLLLCSSVEHCQVINLDFQAEILLNPNIKLDSLASNNQAEQNLNRKLSISESDQSTTKVTKEKTIYLPIFQNEQLDVQENGHLNEIIGPINDKLCCRIDVKFDNCLQINLDNINALFCLNLISTKPSLVDQFEIIEQDGYSQIHHKSGNEIDCKTFLLPIYDKQLNEDNNPLFEKLEDKKTSKNPLHSSLISKLIYFNFFVFKNDHLAYYLIDHNFKIEKFKLNQIDIKNFNLKSVTINGSFIYVLTDDSLYTYYFGLFNILNNIHQLKFTSILDQNLSELLKTVRPLLLNKNLFLGSHQLINTPVQLIVLSQDDRIFTKYSLKKPSPEQSLYDAKESLELLNQELNQWEKINFYFYLINLCKTIKLNQELENQYELYCIVLLKLLIDNFPSSNSARKLIMEFVFKYTNLKLIDLIEKDSKFIFKHYDNQLENKSNNKSTKSILEELLEQLAYEDKLNQSTLYDSVYDYEQQELLSNTILEKSDDINILKLIQYLNTNLNSIFYLIFKHRFNKSNWELLKNDLINKVLDSNAILAKSKVLFDCEQFDELEKLIMKTTEMNLYCELTNYKEIVISSIDFLSHLVKLDLAKVMRFLHLLISSNISSEFILSIFKDDKLLFILLDNYLCVTRSEKIPEKLLINLVINYWKILNNELNYEALCDELGLKYRWKDYRTTFINLLQPLHVDSGSKNFSNDKSDNKYSNYQCLCSSCSPTFNKLLFILKVYSSNNEIKSLLNHLIKNSQTSWSWKIKIQISDFLHAISILYEKEPEKFLFFILEQEMNDQKWALLIDFLNKKQKIHGLDSKQNYGVIYHLANILSPLEFIKLIPPEWKPIINYYFKFCLEKYQAKCIKNQIMSYLDKN